jgi:hypothetical protein
MRVFPNPWDDLSNLENHYCHPHEMFHDDLTGIQCCPTCRDAKLAAHFRKQTIQKETNDARQLHKET